MTGVPSESQLPYASLQGLLWPVMDEADALPPPQRAALDAALGVSADAPADPYRTGLAVLGLLGDAAERAPVVVVAEDAHWLDDATAEVLAFVARRIEADPIAMLITSREEIPRSLRGAGLPAAPAGAAGRGRGGGAAARARPAAGGRDAQADPRPGAGQPARAGGAARRRRAGRAGAADLAAAQHAARADVRRPRRRPPAGDAHRAARRRADRSRGRHRGARRREPGQRRAARARGAHARGRRPASSSWPSCACASGTR